MKVRYKIQCEHSDVLKVLNPVLYIGEFISESDTGIVKCGDGKKSYNDLPVLGVIQDDVLNYLNSGLLF